MLSQLYNFETKLLKTKQNKTKTTPLTSPKSAWRTSHLLLLVVMVVVVRRLVRRCREVVRSIALVVHHIQATHSDGTRARGLWWETVGGEKRARHGHSRGFRRALPSQPSVPPYMPKRIQWPCRPVCMRTMRLPLRAPPAPPGATKWFKTICDKLYPTNGERRKSVVSAKFSKRFWLEEDSFPTVSLFLFWRGVIFRRGLGPFTHAHRGRACTEQLGVLQGTNTSREGSDPSGCTHS